MFTLSSGRMPIWWDARGLVRDTRQGVRHVCIATMPKKTENLPLLASGGVAACDGRFLSRPFFAADCACLRWLGEARLPNRRPAHRETLGSVPIRSNLFGLFHRCSLSHDTICIVRTWKTRLSMDPVTYDRYGIPLNAKKHAGPTSWSPHANHGRCEFEFLS